MQAEKLKNKYHQKQHINQVSLHPISRNNECIPALKGPNIILKH
jgi:diketogulonate reductase-like aldo/keto reductase